MGAKKPRAKTTKFIELLKLQEQLLENIESSINEEERNVLNNELINVKSQINKIKKYHE